MTKELIKAEIDRVDEDQLDELYEIVLRFSRGKEEGGATLMDQLMEIRIEAPEDFAANFDLYLNGEKSV